MQELLDKIKDFAKEQHKNDISGHNFAHILRVYDMAMLLADDYPQVDRFTLTASAFLHDVDDYKIRGERQEKVPTFLTSLGLDKDKVTAVCDTIKASSYSENMEKSQSILTIEAKILSDADKLDVLGAVGILRAVIYGQSVEQACFLPQYFPNFHLTQKQYRSQRSDGHTVGHIFEKSLRVKLYTERAQEIGRQRKQFIKDFLRQLFQETKQPDWIKYLDDFSDNNNDDS